MKHRIFSTVVVLTSIAVLTSFASSAVAQTTSAIPTLGYGAANVLKLSQARIADETVIAYVEKSGLSYGNLGASELIYLRDQGVSDRVLTSMLEQEKKNRDAAFAQSIVQQTAAATQVVTPTAPVVVAPQYQQTYVPPQVTYVQTTPAPLIVMRDSSPRLADYGIYPPRYGYGCYPNYSYRSYGNYHPGVSFSVGISGHHGGFGFRSGGFRNGYCP